MSAIRRSLAAVTSRAETAAATAKVLQQEEQRTAGQTHSAAAQLVSLTSQVSNI